MQFTIRIPDCPGCCDPCEDHSDLEVVVSGVVACDCQDFSGVGIASNRVNSFSGINGSFVATWDAGVERWVIPEMGIVDWTLYASVSCVDFVQTDVYYCTGFIDCTEDGFQLIIAAALFAYPTTPGSGFGFAREPLGDPAAFVTCPQFPGTVGIGNGSATLDRA